MTTFDDTPPILVLADLHGHVDLFDAAVEEGRARAGRADVTVVTLGDYCDNGPDVPRLLERLASFAEEHPGKFLPILGNHDLACLMALEHPEGDTWWTRWQLRYANGHAARTGTQYGATTCAGFRASFPERHRAFLASLPWARRVGDYVFVHAGLAAGDVEPQLETLALRDMTPYAVGHQPPWLRERALGRAFDPAWPVVVVSGHVKHDDGEDFLAPNRLSFHSGTCRGGALHAALLPAAAGVGDVPLAKRFVVGGRARRG